MATVQMNSDTLALGVLWYVVFLISTTCHEAAHALAARIGGDPTAALAGQASLNPIPHIRREPFGTVIVPIASYLLGGWMIGWASAPYDPNWQMRYPRRAAWMALAGPGANFVLVIVAAAAIRLGMLLGKFSAPHEVTMVHLTDAVSAGSAAGFAATFLSILFVLNLLLGTFNLLPVPPLDGNTGVTLLLPESAALRFLNFTRSGFFGPMGLVVAWLVFNKLFASVFTIGLNLLYPGAGYH